MICRVLKFDYSLLSILLFTPGWIDSSKNACAGNGKEPKIQFTEIEVNGRGPIQLWEYWYMEAQTRPENLIPEAMSMSTVQKDGRPAARTLLLRGYDEHGFKIYTDYTSPKAIELENGWTALVFLWYYVPKGEVNATGTRQVRVEGYVTKLGQKENREYFEQEPVDAQVRAVVQKQSKCIGGARRKEILKKTEKLLALAQCPGYKVPFPKDWGGYYIHPQMLEFYQSEPNSIADRIKFVKRDEKTKEGRPCRTYNSQDNWIYQQLEA